MESTQSRVSSGLRVGSASDNAAYWSIATTMRSDKGSLSTVQDALGLGAAKVDTAYSAMESAIDVVTEIKNKLVAASGTGRRQVQGPGRNHPAAEPAEEHRFLRFVLRRKLAPGRNRRHSERHHRHHPGRH
ncbi:flagellin [Neorhizobium galegae]|nr:flagellin [Neorhizobium galegae]